MAGSPLRTHMDLPPLSSSREQRPCLLSIGEPVLNRYFSLRSLFGMTDRLEVGWYRENTLVPFWDGCFFISHFK